MAELCRVRTVVAPDANNLRGLHRSQQLRLAQCNVVHAFTGKIFQVAFPKVRCDGQ